MTQKRRVTQGAQQLASRGAQQRWRNGRKTMARFGWERKARAVLLFVALSGVTALVDGPLSEAARAQEVAGHGEAAKAKKVIDDTIIKALAILRDAQLKNDSKARIQKLRTTVDPVFDWEAMAMGSIGPHWRKLDEGERKEFVGVFKELLARQYMDDIDRFQGEEQLQVKGAVPKGDLVTVQTILVTLSREEVPIDYTMHKPDGAWLVSDVSIEGVSMVNHYRSSFTRFLVNGDFSALLAKLKRRLGAS